MNNFWNAQNHTGMSRVMITGATGGLGKAFAVECASRGWNLYLTDLRPDLLETLAVNLRQTYRVRVDWQASDLTDPNSRAELIRQAAEDRAPFSALINVAGVDFEGPFFDQSPQQIRTIIRLNVEGTLDMIRGMLSLRDPLAPFRIINVASLAGFYPMPVKATYAASKRFLLDFSLALRNELLADGVTVTALCPAGMPTNAECIDAIEAQGLLGQLTTCNTGSVANETLNAALRGKAVVIPGGLNRFLQAAGSLLPGVWVAELVGWRWKAARRKRFAQNPAAA